MTGILTDTRSSPRCCTSTAPSRSGTSPPPPPTSTSRCHPPDGDPAGFDAVFLSPHKFIGGPGTPGVLIVNRKLLTNTVPDVVGGGTVAYVNPLEHRYLTDPAHREEGGTPAIIESIRAGLVFGLKEEVGVATIHALERDFLRRALGPGGSIRRSRCSATRPPNGSRSCRSWCGAGGRYLHHNVVVAILNDVFGIQSRGGCSCAGPYGHRLLGIDLERSHEFEREITGGCEGIKPGWVRVSFNYFISDAVFRYIVRAVEMVAEHGWKLVPQYRFSIESGLWRHENGPVEPPMRLAQLSYDAEGGSPSPGITRARPSRRSTATSPRPRRCSRRSPSPCEDGASPTSG